MKTAVSILWFVILNNKVRGGEELRRFPDDFFFGTSTAAYQIEGAWNASDKGENIWDHLTRTRPEEILDGSNGDIAADSYHNYKRDVEMLHELGVDVYRFSLSWTRILPSGFSNHVSKIGVKFYNKYINEMIKYNITPIATLYHWDLPQKLQELGGWTNPLIMEWFEDYARIAYDQFGDRVKHWITINEPREICYQGYGSATLAPMINSSGLGEYLCAKNVVMAHVRAYHLYDKVFRKSQGGECGITLHISAYLPLTDSKEDSLAVDLFDQAQWGLYTHPIFTKEGGFPKELKQRISEKSQHQGYPRSRLPEFTEEEKLSAIGAYDFLGVNHYTGRLVSAKDFKTFHPVPSLYDDVDAGEYIPPEWSQSVSPWLQKMPNSLYIALRKAQKYCNDPIIYITENGWSTTLEAGLIDDDRISFIRDALYDASRAIEDGVRLKAYMAWSLMDNFEWTAGYLRRFGLYEVNYTDPARTRTPRKSALWYKHVVKTHTVDHDYEPNI